MNYERTSTDVYIKRVVGSAGCVGSLIRIAHHLGDRYREALSL